MEKQNRRGRINLVGLRGVRVALLPLMVAGWLAGCSSLGMSMGDQPGNMSLDPQDLNAYVSNQDGVYQALLKLAALPDAPASPAEWKQFILAGVQYTNQHCETRLVSGRGTSATLAARNAVHALQQQFVEKLQANQYTHRVAAFSALQGYASLCLPGNIEAASAGNVRVVQPASPDTGSLNAIPYVIVGP